VLIRVLELRRLRRGGSRFYLLALDLAVSIEMKRISKLMVGVRAVVLVAVIAAARTKVVGSPTDSLSGISGEGYGGGWCGPDGRSGGSGQEIYDRGKCPAG